MVEESSSVSQSMHVLLWWGLWRRREKIGDLFDTLGKIEFRLLADALSLGFRTVKKLGVDVEERVVLLVLGCIPPISNAPSNHS